MSRAYVEITRRGWLVVVASILLWPGGALAQLDGNHIRYNDPTYLPEPRLHNWSRLRNPINSDTIALYPPYWISPVWRLEAGGSVGVQRTAFDVFTGPDGKPTTYANSLII